MKTNKIIKTNRASRTNLNAEQQSIINKCAYECASDYMRDLDNVAGKTWAYEVLVESWQIGNEQGLLDAYAEIEQSFQEFAIEWLSMRDEYNDGAIRNDSAFILAATSSWRGKLRDRIAH